METVNVAVDTTRRKPDDARTRCPASKSTDCRSGQMCWDCGQSRAWLKLARIKAYTRRTSFARFPRLPVRQERTRRRCDGSALEQARPAGRSVVFRWMPTNSVRQRVPAGKSSSKITSANCSVRPLRDVSRSTSPDGAYPARQVLPHLTCRQIPQPLCPLR